MAPRVEPEPWDQDRLTRGRPLTRREIDTVIANHQTGLRHATAAPCIEMVEQLRDELVAYERSTIEERLEKIVTELAATESPELRRAGAVADGALVLIRVWAARVI